MTTELADEQIVIVVSFDGHENGFDDLIFFSVEVAVFRLGLPNQVSESLLLGDVLKLVFAFRAPITLLFVEIFLLLADSEML